MRNAISILSAGIFLAVIIAGIAVLLSPSSVTAASKVYLSNKERSRSHHRGSAEYCDGSSSAACDDNKSTLSGSAGPTPPPPSTTPFNDSSSASDDNKSTLSGSSTAPPPSTTSFNNSSVSNKTTLAGSGLAPPPSGGRRSHHRKRKRGSKSNRGSLTGGQNGAVSDTTAD